MRPTSLAALVVLLALPAAAQDFVLAACNGGKIPIDAFAAVNTPPAVVHIAPDACENVYARNSNDAALVGFAFPDSRGQWGAPHRYDFIPALPARVLARANQSVSVRRGNQTVTTAAQFTFRSEGRVCSTTGGNSGTPNSDALGPKATGVERARAAAMDSNVHTGGGETVCVGRYYEMIVAAYADTHELQFLTDCERCPARNVLSAEEQAADALRQIRESARTSKAATPRKRPDFTPYLQYWPEFTVALAAAGASGGLPPGVPRKIIVRGTVSRIEEAPPNASEHWIDIFFKEAPDGRFDVCSLGPEIFSEVYGPNFRTALIGQAIEVEGEIQRSNCKGFKGNVRISLAHQARRSDATQLAAAMIIPSRPAPKPTPVNTPLKETPYRDPTMPNYDISEEAVAFKVQQYCTGLYDPVMKTEQQNQVRAANMAAVRQEVETCKSHFDPLETRNQRRLAMRYCFGHNNFAERSSGILPTAYDNCMEKNDALTRLCYLELNFRQRSYAVSPRTVEQHCSNVRPNGREAQVILRGGTAENGAPGVIPENPPALPAVLLVPMDAGIMQNLAAPPQAASSAAAKPVAPGPTNPAAAAAAAQTPRLTPEELRKRQQDLAACRRQALKDFPSGGADFTKALADCSRILQQR
jgi:hypothetical protein